MTAVPSGMSEYKLLIDQGATLKLDFAYQDPFGRFIDLSGFSGRMQMRRAYADASPAYSFDTGGAGGLSIVAESSTVTFSGGSVVWRSHVLSVGELVQFTTTGSLSGTGLATGTPYYVVDTGLTNDSFKVSATPGGTAITINGNGSGVHTCTTTALGNVRLNVGPTITATMFSIYVYDLEVVSGGGEVTRLVSGSAQISPEATK